MRFHRSYLVVAAAGLCTVAGFAVPGTQNVAAGAPFRMGVPTVVDPIRGVGEPDIAVLNSNQPFISGPAGSSTQTSFYWASRDGGQSFYQRGPHNGHWLCPALGGGDSLNVVDRKSGDIYVIDQESLLDLGLGRIDGTSGALSSICLNSPGITADRPFLAVDNGKNSPQVKVDGKTITYLSWQCSGCGGLNTSSLEMVPTMMENGDTPGGGLAFGWTDDGVTYHPAEPGVASVTGTQADKITNAAQESSVINTYEWHGNMVADPVTGDVFTAISCAGGSCPNFKTDNEFGVAVGIPPATVNPANPGQFGKLYFQTAADKEADGSAIPNPGSLFPVVAMDSARTLYEAWVQGNGSGGGSSIAPSDWHLYYTYSTCDASDQCTHSHWSKPIQVDQGPQTAASTFGWMTAGDKGKLGFIWLGTSTREHPSNKNTNKVWYPFTAITTNGDTAHPSFEQTRMGVYPNHLSDICLHGTTCAVPDTNQKTLGNRNMADFISADIGPDGALQVTWADDANNLATLPTSLLPGLPVTMYARETSGPRLIGNGQVQDSRFSDAPAAGQGDQTGDALYPVDTAAAGNGSSNVPQLDLTGTSVSFDGSNLTVHIGVKDLSSLASPDTSDQTNVWWMTAWQFNNHIYFARAESNAGGAPTFAAGTPASYDRPGICMCSSPTLVDYSGGTAVTGKQTADGFDITVPASLVGNPKMGDELGSLAAYSMLDNGKQLIVAPGYSNIPSIVDASPATNVALVPASEAGQNGNGHGGSVGSTTAAISIPNTSAAQPAALRAAGLAGLAVLGVVLVGRRRRRGGPTA